MDIRLWIVAPTRHRQAWRESKKNLAIVDPGEEWFCDHCGEPIIVEFGGKDIPVPVLFDTALCSKCAVIHVTKTNGWTSDREQLHDTRNPLWWSPNICPCVGCRQIVDDWRI